MAYQPCILGTARLNNFRLNFHDKVTQAGISLGGVNVRTRIAGLSIRDVLNDAPNTCTLTFDNGVAPVCEQSLKVWINTRDPRYLFTGALQTVDLTYEGQPHQKAYPCTAIDDTARANRRRPFGQWTNISATTYAIQLMQQFAAGFSTAGVQAGLPPVSVILDGTEGMSAAMAQGAQAIGGYYLFENNTLFFFQTPPPTDAPDPIDGTPGRLLDDPPITVSRDDSQLRTRQYGRGHGEPLLADIGIGETVVPVANVAAWFGRPGSGLRAIALNQRLQYTGIQAGGTGSLVGPGAAPGNPPLAAVVLGGAVNSGTHNYAFTFITPSGETLPSPLAVIAVGLMSGPTTAPTPGAPGAGAGPDAGTHAYGVTFLTASGETAVGPASASVTTGDQPIAPPTLAPHGGTPTVGPGPDYGSHVYATTFFMAGYGETVAGPTSAPVITGPVTIAPPSTAPNAGAPTNGSGPEPGAHLYAVTYVTGFGETTPGPTRSVTTSDPAVSPPPSGMVFTPTAGGDLPWDTGTTYHWYVTFVTAAGETTVSPPVNDHPTFSPRKFTLSAIPIGPPGTLQRRIYLTSDASINISRATIADNVTTVLAINSAAEYNAAFLTVSTLPPSNTAGTYPQRVVSLTSIPIGPAGTTARKLYRTAAGQSQLRFLVTLGDNTTATWVDGSGDANLGANAPTSGAQQPATTVPVSSVAIGPTGTTARNVYRTTAGGSQLKFIVTLNDNSTTSFVDTTTDANVGTASPPTTGATAPLRVVPLTAIPLGPAGTTSRALFRTAANGAQLRRLATIADNTTTTYTDTTTDAGLGANAPTVGTAPANAVNVSGIAVGAAPTTSRKIYRTIAGGAQLKLLATLGDNATTTFADTSADAALGANAPTADTSGLAQPSGQVLVGSPSLIVASAASFPSFGWALVGSLLVVRYTGISGNSLTGIPTSGPGAITTTIIYGTQVLPAPALTGVSGVAAPIGKGTAVCVWVQRDDATAQAEQAAIDAANGLVPADGIYEGPLLVDERRNEESMTALCDATLVQFSRPIVTVRYCCRDVNTKSGKTVRIDIADPPIHETLTIQEVTITEIDIAPGLAPRFAVVASSARFSLDDIVRRLLLAADSITTQGRDTTS